MRMLAKAAKQKMLAALSSLGSIKVAIGGCDGWEPCIVFESCNVGARGTGLILRPAGAIPRQVLRMP